jgi:hypothetical protein
MNFIKLPLFLYLFTSIFSSPNIEENANIEKKIDQAISNYIVQLNFLFSANEEYFLRASDNILNADLASINQSNDLKQFGFKEEDEMELHMYVQGYEEGFKNSITGEFREDSKIIHTECPLITETGQKYTLVSIDRELIKNKKTVRIAYVLFVNTTNYNNYFIEYSLTRNFTYLKFPDANNCKSKLNEIDEATIKTALFNQIKNEADAYFLEGNFFQAKEKYQKAERIFPNNQDIVDGINNCSTFIIEDQKTAINKIIENQKYQQALNQLGKIKNKYLKQDTWFQNSINLCTKKINKINDANQLRKADASFNTYQTQKATLLYKTLLSSAYVDQNYILNQLIKCKERDPNFVQNKLNIAFKRAVKSKKNYLETFKTYTRYESTGLLSAKQYYFMCLMMINKHKIVAKPMGYTKNQAAILSRVYFYKCRDLGKDVTFLENQIFTKSINKAKH